MVQPPAGNHSEPLALCWLFPLSSLPPRPLPPRSVIGRAVDCDVCLAGRAVSRHHAEVTHAAEGTRLSDLRSTNGVSLNGVGVSDSPVATGDLVRLGNWVGCFAPMAASEPNPGEIGELGGHLWGGAAFARALEPVRAAAGSTLPLTLIGESGTGKRLVARALHLWSGRQGPFHALNCATLSERQIEAELFGRRARRGTRARSDGGGGSAEQQGLVHATQGGTLLLEEASELSPALLKRLSEVLGVKGEHSGDPSAAAGVRLVLTRQNQRGGVDPLAETWPGSDAGLELRLPPLRQRVPEIPALFSHFVNLYSKGEPFALDAELIEALCLYAWPGNVRELEFLARQLVALHHGAREVTRQHLPRRILDAVKRRAQGKAAQEIDAAALADTARSTTPLVPTSGQRPRWLESRG